MSGFGIAFLIGFLTLFVLPGILVIALFTAPLVVLLLPVFLFWAAGHGAVPEHLPEKLHLRAPPLPLDPAHQH
jgi:hypothetical protein